MRKKKFFENLGNICIFGLCVTMVCFVIYGMGGIMLVNVDIDMINYYDDRKKGM